MSTPQLSDLLSVPDQDTVLNQEVFPELKSRKVRITDWLTGGVYLAMANVVAKMRVNVRLAIASFVAASFEDYVFGFSTPPPNPDGSIIDVTGWAAARAKDRYGTEQIDASYTLRDITLTNSVNTSYGPIQAGNFMIRFPSGNRYVNKEAFTIPPSSVDGGVIKVTFRSELTTNTTSGRAYNDPSDSSITLVTSNYPGVTATNPTTDYSSVSQTGGSLGSVTPSGSPVGDHLVAVRIESSGNAGDSSVGWSTQVDTEGWVSQSGDSASDLGGYGIDVTLTDNTGSPAFLSGETFYFNTPGSDITQVGADAETPQQLGTRCRGLIPALAFSKDGNGNWIPGSPVDDAYRTLILNANTQVRVVFLAVDDDVNDKIVVVIAGDGGVPLPANVVANVQSFLDSFAFLTDLPDVSTSAARAITLAGLTITCNSKQRVAASAAMTKRLQVYLGSVDPATPLGINGLVDYDYILALVRTTPGVTRVSGTLTINGGATNLQLPVTSGAFESARWTQSADTAFSWSTT